MKVRFLYQTHIGGGKHAPADAILDVEKSQAADLISSGKAEIYEEEKEVKTETNPKSSKGAK